MHEDRGSFLKLVEERNSGIRRRLQEVIVPERAFAVFSRIADTYAPTLTASHTRAPVLGSILQEAEDEGLVAETIRFNPDWRFSGVAAAFAGNSDHPRTWSVSHLDHISFLTGRQTDGGYPVTPFCQSRQNAGSRRALALDFDVRTGEAKTLADGVLESTDKAPGSVDGTHFFRTENSGLPLGTRVCYASEARWDRKSGMAYGCIDNAACCAAQVLALVAAAPYAPDVAVLWPDEEEGVVDVGPPTFSRAALRLVHRTPAEKLPRLALVSDIQDLLLAPDVSPHEDGSMGHGASMECFASGTRGAVTPPRLLGAMRQLLPEMRQMGISVREMSRYVNRSDDVSMVMATPNIVLLSCPGAFTHFQDTPRVHIDDIVHLAKALAITWLAAELEEWRTLCLN